MKKFLRSRLSSRQGFSLVELMFYGMMASVLLFMAAPLLSKPSAMTNQILAQSSQLLGTQAADFIANDLKQATKLDYAMVTPTQFSFPMAHYDLSGSSWTLNVTYTYMPDGHIQRELFDPPSASTTTTMVIQNVDAPTAGIPLVKPNPDTAGAPTITILTLQYHPSGYAAATIFRRVSIGA